MSATDVQLLIDKIKTKSNKLKWLIGLGGALLLAPIAWALAYAILGAAALAASLAVAAIVGAVILYGTPVVLMKLQNAKINAIIAEATKNPIPTLWQEWEKDGKEIDALDNAVSEYCAEIENCKDKIKKLAGKLTEEDIQRFSGDIQLMEADLEQQEKDLQTLRDEHADFKTSISRAEAIYDVSMAMDKANAKNRLAFHEEMMTRIKKETAYDAVMSSMNTSKARLRARIQSRRHLSQSSDTPAIEVVSSEPLQLGSVVQPHKTSVPSKAQSR